MKKTNAYSGANYYFFTLTTRVESVPVSDTAAAAAMATTSPASRIVRRDVSTREGNIFYRRLPPRELSIFIFSGQEGDKNLTPVVSLWTVDLAGL